MREGASSRSHQSCDPVRDTAVDIPLEGCMPQCLANRCWLWRLHLETPMCWRSRFFEIHSFRSLLKAYFEAGANWIAAPRP